MISELSFSPPLVLSRVGAKLPANFPLDLKIFGPGTDKTAIYALRYRAFIQSGVITPREDRLFSDAYDDLDTTTTIAAFDGATCAGTFRLTFGQGRPGAHTMPCQSIFGEVGGLGAAGYQQLVAKSARQFIRRSISSSSDLMS